jgi:hypothetical protein
VAASGLYLLCLRASADDSTTPSSTAAPTAASALEMRPQCSDKADREKLLATASSMCSFSNRSLCRVRSVLRTQNVCCEFGGGGGCCVRFMNSQGFWASEPLLVYVFEQWVAQSVDGDGFCVHVDRVGSQGRCGKTCAIVVNTRGDVVPCEDGIRVADPDTEFKPNGSCSATFGNVTLPVSRSPSPTGSSWSKIFGILSIVVVCVLALILAVCIMIGATEQHRRRVEQTRRDAQLDAADAAFPNPIGQPSDTESGHDSRASGAALGIVGSPHARTSHTTIDALAADDLVFHPAVVDRK